MSQKTHQKHQTILTDNAARVGAHRSAIPGPTAELVASNDVLWGRETMSQQIKKEDQTSRRLMTQQ